MSLFLGDKNIIYYETFWVWLTGDPKNLFFCIKFSQGTVNAVLSKRKIVKPKKQEIIACINVDWNLYSFSSTHSINGLAPLDITISKLPNSKTGYFY